MKRFYEKFAKWTLLSIFIIFFSKISFATTYYVSTAGNNSNSGLSSEFPWATLSKVNASLFQPGDSILFKRGDLWRELLKLPSSGNSSAYISFSSYGTGNKPIIYGSKQAAAWINLGNNIWKSGTILADPHHDSLGNLTGNVFFVNSDSTIETGVLKTSIETLVSDKDWYWESNLLYVYSTINPDSKYLSVEAAQRRGSIELNNQHYIEVNGIDMFYDQWCGIYDQWAPTIKGSGFILRNCEIAFNGYPNGDFGYGVAVIYSNSLIENNIIHDCGRRGVGFNLYGSYRVSNIVVQNNTFYRGYHTTSVDIETDSGSSGIIDSVFIRNNLISETPNYNDVSTPMLMFIANQVTGSTVSNIYIYNNIFKYSSSGSGIQIEKIQSAFIYNNTFYGHNEIKTGSYQLYFNKNCTNIKIRNNIFYSQIDRTGNAGLAFFLTSTQSYTGIDSDYNIFYRISNSLNVIHTETADYTLADAATITSDLGWETHSIFSDPLFVSSSDNQLLSISPAINKGVDVGITTDFAGNLRTGIPDIGAYGINIPVYFTEFKSICEGSSYNGWVTSGKYERTLMAASGVDSLVTTYLTVNPKYAINENITITEGDAYQGWVTSGQYFRTLTSVSGCDSIVTTNLTVEKLMIKQGEIVPVHYSTVWQGENGLNHMNIMVVSAILEDLPLSVDDEIAVFSNSICVGAKMLSQPINATDNSTFLTIPASQNDGTNNGFTDNDPIIFKIWDNKNQIEMIAKAITYRNDVSSWLTSGKFVPGATSVVEIVSYLENTQSIELKKGYNMISTYVTAQNPNVSSVTQSLCNEGDLIKMQDEAGNSFENWGSFGGWINNVGSIENTEGYKIKVANNCTLNVTGRPIALPLDIPLKTGWNIISFPHSDMIDAMNIIQSLIDMNKLVKVQDEIGNSIENWGIFGGWKNGIGYFIPGKAYKVKMSADAVLTIQQNYTKSAVILVNTEKTNYFSTGIEGNGTDHMNINLVGLHESDISIGDELAAFDGKKCIGTLKITENHLIVGSASLIASFSTDDQNRDGFIVGDIIQISAWNKSTGDVSEVQVEVIDGQMKYAINASVLAKMKSLSTSANSFVDNMKIDVFPNPSKGKVTVRFSTMPDSGSRIDILDISGRKVTSRLISGISEEFNLDQQPAGLYLVKSILGSNETIQKLIINR